MKNKALMIAIVAVAAVIIIGLVLIARPKNTKTPAPAAKGVQAKTALMGKTAAGPVKRALSKDMGALTVKLLGAKNKELAAKARLFKAVDSRSSVYSGAMTTGRMQELSPGTYDIEIETVPPGIYKGVNVPKGRETVEDLGRLTGSLEVQASSYGKKAASYPVRVLHERSSAVIANGIAGRAIELTAGTYDIQVDSMPRQMKKGIRIESGKDITIDIGAAGALLVKVTDETGKEARSAIRIKKTESGELVTAPVANRAVEMMPGTYIVEIGSVPPQSKKDVKINAGEETIVEFIVKAPVAPAPKPVPAAAAAPAKK